MTTYVSEAGQIVSIEEITRVYNKACIVAVMRATKNAWVDDLKYFITKYPQCKFIISNVAATNGHLNIIQWVIKYGMNIQQRNSAIFNAKKENHLDIVEFIENYYN